MEKNLAMASIAQEFRTEMVKDERGFVSPDNDLPVTFILVPESRFRSLDVGGLSGDVMFRGIPVTYWGGDEIKYCTF